MTRGIIGRDWSDIYVAACGEPFDTRSSGKDHEKNCVACQAVIMEVKNRPRYKLQIFDAGGDGKWFDGVISPDLTYVIEQLRNYEGSEKKVRIVNKDGQVLMTNHE